MKICKKIRKIIKIRLKNFSTKNQKSILADILKNKKKVENCFNPRLSKWLFYLKSLLIRTVML